MKAQVITIDAAVNGDCAVNVYFDDGTPNWRIVAKASGMIATELTKPPHPKDAAGNPLAPNGIAQFLQEQERPNPATFGAIGEHLWSLLAQGAVGVWLSDTFAAHWKSNALDVKDGIRTILDIRDKTVQSLPWELTIRQNQALFASPLNPFVRGSLNPAATGPVSSLMLRVLVVVGSAPKDDHVKAEEEIENIEDAARILRREIDLRVEYPHKLDDLNDLIADFKPHVLHFIGHGGEVTLAGRQDPVASLVFQDGAGGIWDWTTDDVPTTLAVGAPRLAFLNACRTGTGVDPGMIVGALSAEFLKTGTAAVVSMQADIAGGAAAEFAGVTYAALAKGEPLDVALAKGRRTVKGRAGGRRDWCLPSLTVGVDVTEVLPSRLSLSQRDRDRLEATPEFVDIRAFVDRHVQRRSVDPMADPAQLEDVVIVTGPAKTGKTSMLLWFLEGCAWCGHAVKYVDLRRDTKPGFLEALESIQQAETNPPSDLRQALPGDFARVQQLIAIARAGQPAAGATPDNPIDSLFTAFRAALVHAAQGKPLILALDHLGSMDSDAFRNYLRPYLLEHVAQKSLRPVRLVLTCSDDDYVELRLSRLLPAKMIKVNLFAVAEFSTLYRDYMLCRQVPRAKIPPPIKAPPADFPPKMLPDMYEFMRMYNLV